MTYSTSMSGGIFVSSASTTPFVATGPGWPNRPLRALITRKIEHHDCTPPNSTDHRRKSPRWTMLSFTSLMGTGGHGIQWRYDCTFHLGFLRATRRRRWMDGEPQNLPRLQPPPVGGSSSPISSAAGRCMPAQEKPMTNKCHERS